MSDEYREYRRRTYTAKEQKNGNVFFKKLIFKTIISLLLLATAFCCKQSGQDSYTNIILKKAFFYEIETEPMTEAIRFAFRNTKELFKKEDEKNESVQQNENSN